MLDDIICIDLFVPWKQQQDITKYTYQPTYV